MNIVTTKAELPRWRRRLFALALLISLSGGVGWLGHEGYRAATDSFVAPIIFTPDNDLVIASRLKLGELELERARIDAQLRSLDTDIAAREAALARMRALMTQAQSAMAWTTEVSSRQARTAGAELKLLVQQRDLLAATIGEQERLVAAAERNMNAGLVARTDYAHEVQLLNQLKLGLLDNARAQKQAGMSWEQASAARRSASGADGAPLMPELQARRSDALHLELEMLRLESELRAERAEKQLLDEKRAKIDEIAARMKDRPALRAVEQNVNVAFVPYSQLDAVKAGAKVFDCVWGLFRCRSVGRVSEIVPGEVVLPDPWGSQARGQYAILDLADPTSARSKALRVRWTGTHPSAATERHAAR